MLVKVRRWKRSAAAEGRWGSLNKCGVKESMTVRPAGSSRDQRSDPSTQIPRVEVF